MEDLVHLVKTAGPRMVPFIKAVTVYFMLVTFEPKGETWTTIVKCAPIVCLMFFVRMWTGFNFSQENTYCHRILLGLIASCAGDALLNVDLFLHGMIAFAVAQMFYISAFGFCSPAAGLYPWIGLGLYTLGACFSSLIFNALEEEIKVGLPIYAVLLLTMSWRAIARTLHRPNLISILCALGTLFFVVSDACIAVDKYYIPIPHARIYIMTTYYAAQFGITLSIVNEAKLKGSSKQSSEKEKIRNEGVSKKKLK